MDYADAIAQHLADLKTAMSELVEPAPPVVCVTMGDLCEAVAVHGFGLKRSKRRSPANMASRIRTLAVGLGYTVVRSRGTRIVAGVKWKTHTLAEAIEHAQAVRKWIINRPDVARPRPPI